MDNDRESGFYWQDFDDFQGDPSNDFFGEFVDFGGGGDPTIMASTETQQHTSHQLGAHDPTLFNAPPSLLLDHPGDSNTTGSSGVSTSDDFDFLSSSSQVGATVSTISQDVDPKTLAVMIEGEPDIHFQPPGLANSQVLHRLNSNRSAAPRYRTQICPELRLYLYTHLRRSCLFHNLHLQHLRILQWRPTIGNRISS